MILFLIRNLDFIYCETWSNLQKVFSSCSHEAGDYSESNCKTFLQNLFIASNPFFSDCVVQLLDPSGPQPLEESSAAAVPPGCTGPRCIDPNDRWDDGCCCHLYTALQFCRDRNQCPPPQRPILLPVTRLSPHTVTTAWQRSWANSA